MPTIEENKGWWSGYDWSENGDEWSGAWGTPLRQWTIGFVPRIGSYLPCRRILEIAPGFGRWTQFLLQQCDGYIGLDITPKCIEHCKKRFADNRNAAFFLNDGQSLPDMPDGNIDFVFSADSLVHADETAINGYLSALSKKLAVGAVGFIHHSNIGMYNAGGTLLCSNEHMREPTMSANLFRSLCEKSGLKCISQELISWGQPEFNDCFSVFARLPEGHRLHSQPTVVWTNNSLDKEQIIGRNYGIPI